MSLLTEERRKKIIDELEQNGKVKVLSLAASLDVSSETIRRDLDVLEQEGKLKRCYGGAVKRTFQDGEPPYKQRMTIRSEEKVKIGEKGAELIQDGDTLIFDSGTTVYELAKALKGKSNLTIITSSLPVASLLTFAINQRSFTGKLIMLGGEINSDQESTSGVLTEKMLEKFYVDKAFISIGGLSITTGITDYDINESLMSKKMISVAKEVIVLADHTKVGVHALYQVSKLANVDVIVCNQHPPESWNMELERIGIEWIVTEGNDVNEG